MKHIQNKLLLCGAFVAVIAGFVLPGVALTAQDKRMSSSVDKKDAEIVQLRNAAQMEDRLKLLSGDSTYLQLGDGIYMNAEEAHQAALTAMRYLQDRGGLEEWEEQESYPLVNPVLVVSEDRSLSAVVWNCQINSKNGQNLVFMIDDSSGKMLSVVFGYPLSEIKVDKATMMTSYDWDRSIQIVEKWVAIMTDYYEFESASLHMNTDTDPQYYMEGTAEFINEMGNVITISISISDQYMAFNVQAG